MFFFSNQSNKEQNNFFQRHLFFIKINRHILRVLFHILTIFEGFKKKILASGFPIKHFGRLRPSPMTFPLLSKAPADKITFQHRTLRTKHYLYTPNMDYINRRRFVVGHVIANICCQTVLSLNFQSQFVYLPPFRADALLSTQNL